MATRNRAGARRATTVARTTGGVVRVALYTRRSTDDEHQPFSIDAQDTRLDAYVASQPGWQIVERFTDDASGATLDRPGLHRALEAAQGRTASTCCWSTGSTGSPAASATWPP